ncbi:MAG TPA: PKD domain-containing protein [Planctomycetota bacterium]|nr:PKD domain-containing protein [Planctomycetota bacterium]
MMRASPKALSVLSALLIAALQSLSVGAATVVATASPNSGNAPLGVFFDGSGSVGASTYKWEFGDGASATDATVTHIYNVAGMYTATLTVFDSTGTASAPAQFTITVNGPGNGPVSADVNFRIAPIIATFRINRAAANQDSFMLRGAFNTVDLPTKLTNLAASIALNGVTVANGFLNVDGQFLNPVNSTKPSYFFSVNNKQQQINFQLTKANLATVLSNAPNATGAATVPVEIAVTVGAQTYDMTQQFDYTGVQNVSGVGTFDLSKHHGNIGDGFFVITQASAIEVPNTRSHFFEFDGFIALPNGALLDVPANKQGGNWIFTFNEADKIFIPVLNGIKKSNGKIVYTQPNRQLTGIHTIVIDTVKRTFMITTWDIKSNANQGGTGLPVRGEAFVSFDFTVRLDLDQFDSTGKVNSTFSVVTATQLSRKTTDDAFWQTGRTLPTNHSN